ncbi:DUF3616 domain-containing protein [Pleionea sediminis]|uniref:DUF3616 domain-containing protein n=1 Tax=Pleionea sediminis TaxID=2569479 RepID=UPI0011851594|nr:DUF3616 domain-containing protein [Pleionea sediminis]
MRGIYIVYAQLIVVSCSLISLATAKEFKVVASGKTALYEYYGVELQDLSSAAYNGNGRLVLGFDGGRNAQHPEVRVVDVTKPNKKALLLDRQIVQKDIEGMTFINDRVYLISSLSQTSEETKDFRILSKMTLNDDATEVASEEYVYLRERLLSILGKEFKNDAWFSRISSSFGKLGGLNVEGLSASDKKGQLVIGLRSPLWHKNFGAPSFGPSMKLNVGEAILVFYDDPFDAESKVSVKTIDLKGQGIRGMEYSAKLDAYIIISGMAEKGNLYRLWLLDRSSFSLTELKVKGFDNLCRPEAIAVVDEESYFYILSEESGKACQNSTVTYLKVAYGD